MGRDFTWQLLKPSAHLDAFHRAFGDVHTFGRDFEAFNITGMSSANGLVLYLDAHTQTGTNVIF
jgi:hypothetical protein